MSESTNGLTEQIHHYLTTGTSSNFLDRKVTIVDQWEGADNLLWRVQCAGDEAVVKYYLDAGQARGRRQYDGQERFHRVGIAPEPLWFDRYPVGLSRQLLVYRWVPGALLTDPEPAQLAQMAQAVAHVHNGDPTDVRRFSPNPLNLEYLWQVVQGGLPSLYHWLSIQNALTVEQQLRTIVERAQTLVERSLTLWRGVMPTPVHGDLKLENTLSSMGSVLLLDWELFGLGDAAYDIALFFSLSQHVLDQEARVLWLEQYLAYFTQPGLADRIHVYGQILPLQHLLFLLHGLRQSQGDEAVLIAANREFLTATIIAAFEQSGAALGLESTMTSTAIAKLFSEQK